MGTHVISKAYATTGDDRWFQNNGIEAVIGMGALRNFNMTTDVGAGEMALSPRTTAMLPMKKSKAGIQGEYKDGRLSVAHVMKNSPAASAGLKDGDQICAIDGQPITRGLSDNWTHATSKLRHTLGLCDGSQRKIKLRIFY